MICPVKIMYKCSMNIINLTIAICSTTERSVATTRLVHPGASG